MPGLQACLTEVQTIVGRELAEKDLERVADRIGREIQKRRAAGGVVSFDDAIRAAAVDEARQAVIEARVRKRNAALNVIRRQSAEDFIAQFDNPADGLQALLVGVIKANRGARMSIDARGKSLGSELIGGMLADLRKDDLIDIVTSGEIDADVAREMWELRDGGNPGVTKNREAKQIADIFAKYKEAARVMENRAGAFIGKLDGHISQAHDPIKVRGTRFRPAGFNVWAAEILPRLDHDRTFAGADPMEFLRNVFDDIVTGEHIGGAVAKGLAVGPSNLGKRVSRARVLHFRSADDWMAYNDRFGRGNLTEGVVHGIMRAAKDTALMEVLGPNPRAMFEQLRKRAKDASRQDLKTFDRLRSDRFETFFRTVSGEADIVGNPTAAQIGQVNRSIQSMSKLGGAMLSSVADIGTVAANTRFRGDGFLTGFGRGLQSVLRGRGRGEVREIADSIGVGIDGTVGTVLSRFSATDELPGTMSKLMTRFFRLTGLNWWTDAQKTGFGVMAAYDLARQAGNGWDRLSDRLRNVLEQYGIEGRDWDVIRQSRWQAGDGRGYITPDRLGDLPEDAFDAGIADWIAAQARRGPYWPRRLARKRAEYRRELETRLRAYFVEEADFAIPTPGARERALMTGGQQPGTAAGEVWRAFFQFKGFPITQGIRTIGRTISGGPGRRIDAPGIAMMIVSMTALGYVAMTAKDLSRGRTPRDPTDPRTWGAAFMQGGAAGIYGDFLFGQHNRFGGGVLATLGGPTAGNVERIARLFAQAREGEGGADQAVGLMLNNTPFINLFYTRQALDYLLLYQIQEFMNPGYLRRLERRLEREHGQTFLVGPPSRVIPRGGGAPRFDQLVP